MSKESLLAQEHCIGYFLVGSHLYGTSTPESDKDYEGVFIEPPEYVIGRLKIEEVNLSTNKSNTRNTSSDTDCKYYTLRRFFDLAALNNPNKLEWFFIPNQNIIQQNEKYWSQVVAAKHLFLSQKAKHSFSGYAASQRHHLINKKRRYVELSRFLEKLNAGVAKGAVKLEELDWTGYPFTEKHENHDAYITVDEANYNMGFNLQKIQGQIQAEVNRYGGRTKGIGEMGYDTKFATHLFRLAFEGLQLMQEGKIDLPTKNMEYLRNIRKGEFTLDEIIAESVKFDEMFALAQKTSVLPHTPDHKAIHELQTRIYMEYWKEKGLI